MPGAFETPTSSPAHSANAGSPLRRRLHYAQQDAFFRRRVTRIEFGAGLLFLVILQTTIVTHFIGTPTVHVVSGTAPGTAQLPTARLVTLPQATSRDGDVALPGHPVPESAVVSSIRAGKIEWTDVAYVIHNELLDNGFAERRIGASHRHRAEFAPGEALRRPAAAPFGGRMPPPSSLPSWAPSHARRCPFPPRRGPAEDYFTEVVGGVVRYPNGSMKAVGVNHGGLHVRFSCASIPALCFRTSRDSQLHMRCPAPYVHASPGFCDSSSLRRTRCAPSWPTAAWCTRAPCASATGSAAGASPRARAQRT